MSLHMIGRGADGDKAFILGHAIRQIFVKDIVYIPATQRSIQQLRDRITRAVQAIRVGMIHNVCNEFDYCAGVW